MVAAAAPLFTFWFGIIVNIWMFLLGIARIFSGTFTPAEIALTVIIAVTCACGIVAVVRTRSSVATIRRLATATAFGILQFAALALSFLPSFR